MLDRQVFASLLAGDLDARAVDDGVRAREVDILEHARGGLALDVAVQAAELAVLDHAHFARLDVADELRAERIERAGLGSKDVAAVQHTDAKRTEAVRVARGDQLARRHDDERIRALDQPHRAQHGLFDRAALEALLNDGVDQHLGVRSRSGRSPPSSSIWSAQLCPR